MTDNEVVARFQEGDVCCALFENEVIIDGQPQQIMKAALSRRYRDRWGYWKSAHSFSKNEIPQAISVLKQAFERMVDDGIQTEIERAIERARTGPLQHEAKRPAA
jgi:hypothetical protein